MARTPEKLIVLALCLCGATLHAFAPSSPASAATIRRVNILGAGQNIEVEITANQPLNPTAQEVKNPERLVIDFPDALPAGELRNISVNRGEVKTVRVGLLTNSEANLSEVLYEVHRRTGADIPIPAGAEQEQVVTDIPPSAPRDAVAMLLNGSHFNFIIIGADGDPSALKRVILSPKGAEGASQPIIYTGNTPVESSPDLPEPAQAEAPTAEPQPIEQPDAAPPPDQQPANEPPPAQVQPDMTPSMPPDGPPQ